MESQPQSEGQAPQAVFSLQIGDQPDSAQIQAISYLKAVRAQKKQFNTQYNQCKSDNESEYVSKQSDYASKQSDNVSKHNENVIINQREYIDRNWKIQCIKNWQILVMNAKYLLKNGIRYCRKQQKAYWNKVNLKLQPLLEQMVQGLILPDLQQLIDRISQDYIQSNDAQLSYNYSLWIYSLLCLHKALAQYINFQSLGSITMCIKHQASKGYLTTFQTTLLTILVQVYHQRHLSNLYQICSKQSSNYNLS